VGSTTGDVLLDTVLTGEGVGVNCAVFKPGARTFWHTHERGQIFFVASGKGMIATRDGGAQIVRAGDVVWTPPGEEHWHGAAPDAFVTYTAISLGKSTFNAEVSDEEYTQTWT
jgi:quercetin dioxygenase-like cupin family protein